MNYSNQSAIKEEAWPRERSYVMESLISSQWIWHSFELLVILIIVVLFKVRVRRTQSALYLQRDSSPPQEENTDIPQVEISSTKHGAESN